MSAFRSSIAALLAILALATVAIADATANVAARGRPLRFTTFLRVWDRPVPDAYLRYWAPDKSSVEIVDSAALASAIQPSGHWAGLLTASEARAFEEAINWNKRVAVAVVITRKTPGYRVTIRRVIYQRVDAVHRQFCVVVNVQQPPAGAAKEPNGAVHIATVSNAGMPFHVTRAFVLRTVTGKLLATGDRPVRPSSCKA